MSLRDEANTLSNAIMGIVHSLEAYAGDQGKAYIVETHARLSPLAVAFKNAVHDSGDRQLAEEVLTDIQPFMHGLAAATTKGEIPVFHYNDKNLDLYFDLHTIFQESRFQNATL